MLVVAALPRADSPSAERYVREREGETAWTFHLGDDEDSRTSLPEQLAAQITQRDHVDLSQRPPLVFDPSARAWDEQLPANFKEPSLDE